MSHTPLYTARKATYSGGVENPFRGFSRPVQPVSKRRVRPDIFGQPLSALEDETMRRLAAGETHKQIAPTRSKTTVHDRVRRVREKLGATTTLQAMYLWSRRER